MNNLYLVEQYLNPISADSLRAKKNLYDYVTQNFIRNKEISLEKITLISSQHFPLATTPKISSQLKTFYNTNNLDQLPAEYELLRTTSSTEFLAKCIKNDKNLTYWMARITLKEQEPKKMVQTIDTAVKLLEKDNKLYKLIIT